MLTPRSALGLAVSVAICFGAAGLGSLLTTPSLGGWYPKLRKPGWTPPKWLFGPVWTLLYLSMAVAAWLVWQRAGVYGAKLALALFAVQLALNVCWSAIFFWAHRPGVALLEIVLLWLLILATMACFCPVSCAAGCLLAPYLLWVTYAVMLNYAIWKLNG